MSKKQPRARNTRFTTSREGPPGPRVQSPANQVVDALGHPARCDERVG